MVGGSVTVSLRISDIARVSLIVSVKMLVLVTSIVVDIVTV
ncbi:MAG: hypothetical protein ACO2O2_17815 [Acidilobaceae archaeon]